MEVNPQKLRGNIKKYRQLKNLSQEDLAIRAKIKLSNLAKLEGGFSTNPTLSTLAAIAKVLTNGSLDQLMR